MPDTDTKRRLRGTSALPSESPEELPDNFPELPPEPPPTVEDLGDGRYRIHLEHPLKPHRGKGQDPLGNLTHIELGEMYAEHMMLADTVSGETEKVVLIAAKMSGHPSIAIRRLDYRDFAKVHGIINGKLGNFLGTSRPLWALSLG